MSSSLSAASISVFEIGLNALSSVLDKAEAFAAAKKVDPAVLLHTRLSPDMFDLTRQVQTVTDQARRGSCRLAGVDPAERRGPRPRSISSKRASPRPSLT
jgi:hypothetical protein